MPTLSIEVDGQPGDAEDLYGHLLSVRTTRGIEFSHTSTRDGTLSLFGTILAVVSTLAGVGSLVVAVHQWSRSMGTTVRIEMGAGRSVVIENADRETIEAVWNLIDRPEDDG